jgi:hypothetical protein
MGNNRLSVYEISITGLQLDPEGNLQSKCLNTILHKVLPHDVFAKHMHMDFKPLTCNVGHILEVFVSKFIRF